MSSKNKKVVSSKVVSKKVSKEPAKKKPHVSMSRQDKKGEKPKAKQGLAAVPKKEAPLDKEKIMLQARTKRATPSIFKIKSRKSTPIVFSLEDVQELLKNKKVLESGGKVEKEVASETVAKKGVKKAEARKVVKQPKQEDYKDFVQPKRFLGAASLTDILGFNPKETKSKPAAAIDEEKLPKQWLKYYKSLIELRNHVLEGLEMHSKETLKRSSKDDAGDLSSYSQHMADAGTDNFDRDFALGVLSSEQDALFEIEEAIQRMREGTYGICEMTGAPITKERLEAVPFTRYGLEGQKQLEATQRLNKERGSVFGETGFEESAKYSEDFEE